MKSAYLILSLLILVLTKTSSFPQILQSKENKLSDSVNSSKPTQAFVEVGWIGSGAVDISIDKISRTFRSGETQRIKLRINDPLEISVLIHGQHFQQDRRFKTDKFLHIDPAGGYLRINIEGEKVVFFYKIPEDVDNDDGKITDAEKLQNVLNEITSGMALVQGGTFKMGCRLFRGRGCLDRELPAHEVTLSDYHIGKHEVTQAQWDAVMAAPSVVSNPKFLACESCPVQGVTWRDARNFIFRLNKMTGKKYRLPTEAEWEFAARGGNNSRGHTYSGSSKIASVAIYGSHHKPLSYNEVRIHRTGQKMANELGLYDMSGNVWEWCEDWYGSYSNGHAINPRGPSSGTDRVIRGGSWSSDAEFCRVTSRDFRPPGYFNINLGFRLAH